MFPSHEDMVREFMDKHNQWQVKSPTAEIPAAVKLFRIRLIAEEFAELTEAIAKGDVYLIADALADLDYVVTGTAIAFGIPHEAVFKEVHRSNMSKPKLNSDGKGGKVEKEGYSPVDLKSLLDSYITPSES